MDNNNLFDVSLIFTPFLSHPTSWAYPKIVGLFVRSHFQTGISSMVLPERRVMAPFLVKCDDHHLFQRVSPV